jgi:hypothetical protein
MRQASSRPKLFAFEVPDAAKKLDTSPERASALSQRSSGRSAGSIPVSLALNIDGGVNPEALYLSRIARIDFLTSMYFSGSNFSLIT